MKIVGSNAQFLRALRGGPMDSTQIGDRWPTNRPDTAGLIKARLIRIAASGASSVATRKAMAKLHTRQSPAGNIYEITDAGRAACPPRNPASAKPRPKPAPRGADVRGPTGQAPMPYRRFEIQF